MTKVKEEILEVGDRVVAWDWLRKHNWGEGTVEGVGSYADGGNLCYFVRLDLFPNSCGDYPRNQLDKVGDNK